MLIYYSITESICLSRPSIIRHIRHLDISATNLDESHWYWWVFDELVFVWTGSSSGSGDKSELVTVSLNTYSVVCPPSRMVPSHRARGHWSARPIVSGGWDIKQRLRVEAGQSQFWPKTCETFFVAAPASLGLCETVLYLQEASRLHRILLLIFFFFVRAFFFNGALDKISEHKGSASSLGRQRRNGLRWKKKTRGENSAPSVFPKDICEWAVPMPCAPSGLMESAGLLLSNRQSADRWPSQSGRLSVKHTERPKYDVVIPKR